MRLDKFLSTATELSRKEAKKVLHASQIKVNGVVSKDSRLQIDIDNDQVTWGDDLLSVATGNRYILLYKPEGFECTLKAKEYPIVTDLIDIPQINKLRIAGRLDVDTTGLLLLSDDGGWLHRITSPKHCHEKVYQITLADAMTADEQNKAVKAVTQGIILDSEEEPTKPATLKFIDETHAELILTEGKYHQVKRMMAYFGFGNKVIELHRSQVGSLTLEGLEKGECRFLKEDEIASF